MNSNTIAPSPELFRKIKGGFVTKGTSFSQWCRDKGVTPTAARSAIVGVWNGPKGQKLRADAAKAAGIEA